MSFWDKADLTKNWEGVFTCLVVSCRNQLSLVTDKSSCSKSRLRVCKNFSRKPEIGQLHFHSNLSRPGMRKFRWRLFQKDQRVTVSGLFKYKMGESSQTGSKYLARICSALQWITSRSSRKFLLEKCQLVHWSVRVYKPANCTQCFPLYVLSLWFMPEKLLYLV